MSYLCRNCGKEAWHVVSIFDEETGEMSDQCNHCGLEGAMPCVPDVYLSRIGQKFENLCDSMGRPYEIQSKRHKKEIMGRLGCSEAGDRVHGAPTQSKTWVEGTREYRRKQFDKDRPMIRELQKKYLDNVRRRA